MTEERNCYIHNSPTRLSCTICGRPICPKCAVSAAVGYRCKSCGVRSITHIEKVSIPRLFLGAIAGLIMGSIAGFLWSYLTRYGILVNWAAAYFAGFCIYFGMTTIIGHKIGKRIQVIAVIIAIISILYNPISIYLRYGSGFTLDFLIANFITIGFSCPINIMSAIFASWAAARHFNFK